MGVPRPKVPKETLKSKSKTKKTTEEGIQNTLTQVTPPVVTVNKQKKTVRLKKDSSKSRSKWQQIPRALLNVILSMLEDSVSPFTDSGNKACQRILDKITDSVQLTLEELKVPKGTWTDSKSLKALKRTLSTEKKRLEVLERDLSLTLEEKIRQTKQLQAQRDRLKTLATTADDQLHVILQKAQESP